MSAKSIGIATLLISTFITQVNAHEIEFNPCRPLEDAIRDKCIYEAIGDQAPSHTLITRCSKSAKKEMRNIIRNLVKEHSVQKANGSSNAKK